MEDKQAIFLFTFDFENLREKTEFATMSTMLKMQQVERDVCV